MSFINRYGPCVGLRLFAIGKYSIELWYCPPKYKIPLHCHPNTDIELFFIWGKNCYFERRDKKTGLGNGVTVNFPESFLKRFTIKNYHLHWFQVSKFPLVFINYEKWIGTGSAKSAADDFELDITVDQSGNERHLWHSKEEKQHEFH